MLEGSCSGREIVSNDDFCGQQSEVSFDAEEGEEFKIRVLGFNGAFGDFNLRISCRGTSDSDSDDDSDVSPTPTPTRRPSNDDDDDSASSTMTVNVVMLMGLVVLFGVLV